MKTSYQLVKITQELAEQRFKAISQSLSLLQPWFPWANENYSLADCVTWIEKSEQLWTKDKDYNFAIINNLSGAYCGEVKIMDVKRDYAERNAALAAWTHIDKLRQGVAHFGVQEAAKFAFDELGLIRLNLMSQIDNIASQKVAESAGAKYEGILRNQWCFNGRDYLDVKLYSLIPNDIK